MTTRSTQPLATNGEGDEPTPIVWSPAAFAAECERLANTMSGDPLHKAMDCLSNDILRSLGFGEGVEIFCKAVAGCHERNIDA